MKRLMYAIYSRDGDGYWEDSLISLHETKEGAERVMSQQECWCGWPGCPGDYEVVEVMVCITRRGQQ